MDQPLTAQTAVESWQVTIEVRLTVAAKDLLEKKHMYQSVDVGVSGVASELIKRIVPPTTAEHFSTTIASLLRSNWIAIDPANPRSGAKGWTPLQFKFPDVKLFCATCDRTEAFNLISAENVLERGAASVAFGVPTTQ